MIFHFEFALDPAHEVPSNEDFSETVVWGFSIRTPQESCTVNNLTKSIGELWNNKFDIYELDPSKLCAVNLVGDSPTSEDFLAFTSNGFGIAPCVVVENVNASEFQIVFKGLHFAFVGSVLCVSTTKDAMEKYLESEKLDDDSKISLLASIPTKETENVNHHTEIETETEVSSKKSPNKKPAAQKLQNEILDKIELHSSSPVHQREKDILDKIELKPIAVTSRKNIKVQNLSDLQKPEETLKSKISKGVNKAKIEKRPKFTKRKDNEKPIAKFSFKELAKPSTLSNK